jgi:TolA-binding protein
MKRGLLAAAVSFALAASLWAQQRDAAPGNSVTGRVIMEDGSAVPASVSVELKCNGQIRRRVQAYANGDFRVSIGSDATETPDITVPADLFGPKIPFDPRSATGAGKAPTGGGDMGRFDASGCELRAVLPGYQSTVVSLGPRRAMENSDVGRLLLRRMAAPDDVRVIPSTQAAPEKAKKAYQNAWLFLQKETPEYVNAAKELDKAVAEYPEFAAAWNLLGRTRFALGDLTGARDALRRSILADPNYAEPCVQLARIELQRGDWAETVRWASHAEQLMPSDPDANYLIAFGMYQLGEFDAAETAALEVKKSPALERYPLTYYVLAAAEARHGDFQSAIDNLRKFLDTKPDPETAESVRKVLAEWTQDAGKQ